jgi:hypothetical protein
MWQLIAMPDAGRAHHSDSAKAVKPVFCRPLPINQKNADGADYS